MVYNVEEKPYKITIVWKFGLEFNSSTVDRSDRSRSSFIHAVYTFSYSVTEIRGRMYIHH